GHEEKHHETKEEVDEGDERNLVIAGALSAVPTNVNTGHIRILATYDDYVLSERAASAAPGVRRLSCFRQRAPPIVPVTDPLSRSVDPTIVEKTIVGGTATTVGPRVVQSDSLLHTLEVDLLAVGHHQVENPNARLVDVVLETLGLAVEEREAHQAHDGGQETPGRAVHGLGDTFREDARLLAGVDGLTTDRAERLDQADDRAEQTTEHREVGEEREEARALVDLRHLDESRFVHRSLNFFIGAVDLDEASLNDAREGRVGGRAQLDGLRDVTGENALLHGRQEHVLVHRSTEQVHGAFCDHGNAADQPERDEVHRPSALLVMVPSV